MKRESEWEKKPVDILSCGAGGPNGTRKGPGNAGCAI